MGLVQQCTRPMVVHNEIIEKELEAVEGTQYVTKESILRRAQEIKGIPLRNVDKTGRLATEKVLSELLSKRAGLATRPTPSLSRTSRRLA